MTATAYNDRQITLIAVVSLCAVLGTVATVLRFVSRRLMGSKFWWDDWLALVAMFFSWVTNIFTYISIRAGLGQHFEELSPDDLTVFGISFWVQELSWTIAMGCIVFSILMFYKRLFPIKVWLRRVIWTIVVFNFGWTVSTFLVLTFQCTPVPYFWDKTIEGGHCVEAPVFYFTNGLISMITVFVVLLVPTPVLWNLQVSTPKKLGLIFSFTIGSFVCAMSIARLLAIRNIHPEDLPWTAVFPGMWSCVEANIGVVSACLPSLMPFFRYLRGQDPKELSRPTQGRFTDNDNSTRRGQASRHGVSKTGGRSESYEDIVKTSIHSSNSDGAAVELGEVSHYR